jgi:regulator of protease activity HflC (stomatin/prohibitin superfamily)
MLIFLGIIAAVLGIALLVISQDVLKDTIFGKISRIKKFILIFIGIALITFDGLLFYAKPGTAYAVQYVWGGDNMIVTQGPKLKAWGTTIPISYEISVKDIILLSNDDGEMHELPENELGDYYRKAQKWEFSDAIKADIAVSVIVGPSIADDSLFLNMADRNRSEEKLISARVMPNIDAALKNTCKLMDAQDYISGKSSDFDRYFKDQLENGMYLVESYYDEEIAAEIIADTSIVRHIKPSKSSKTEKYRPLKDKNGNILRDATSNTLRQYGLTIHQANVTSIDWEESFDERLDKQKDEVAKTQLEKQEAERQYYTAKKEIAAGEAAKAKERASLEKEQIKLTIAAETKAKVAEQNVLVEQAQLDVERLKKLSEKEKADAAYYTNQKLVSAGLTPQERAEMDIQINKDKWDGISKMHFDGVYMMGEGNNAPDGILSKLLGAEVAKGMNTKSIK